MKPSNEVVKNQNAHNKIHKEYEMIHVEIFNHIEQKRLKNCIEKTAEFINTGSDRPTALDYGCGSGNLTKFFIELGFYVFSVDISFPFLKIVREKFLTTRKASVAQINGFELKAFKNNSFDFTATYSVLHHIPDYLALTAELIRVTKPGGVIYLDHEQNSFFWDKDKLYLEFLNEAKKNSRFNLNTFLKKYTKISNYLDGIKRLFMPRYQAEADIHVWPDDHIEWDKIETLFINSKCEIILKHDYLLYKNYPMDTYLAFKDRCSDFRCIAARKIC